MHSKCQPLAPGSFCSTVPQTKYETKLEAFLRSARVAEAGATLISPCIARVWPLARAYKVLSAAPLLSQLQSTETWLHAAAQGRAQRRRERWPCSRSTRQRCTPAPGVVVGALFGWLDCALNSSPEAHVMPSAIAPCHFCEHECLLTAWSAARQEAKQQLLEGCTVTS